MKLIKLLQQLQEFSPLELAESWDNVGLLTSPTYDREIKSILFTIDLTKEVLGDAEACKADMIYCYHPPIFLPLKSLNCENWKQNIILQCIEKGVALFSPHTALDAVEGGINDWIMSCFELSICEPVQNLSKTIPEQQYVIKCEVHDEEFDVAEVLLIPKLKLDFVSSSEGFKIMEIKVLESYLTKLLSLLAKGNIRTFVETSSSPPRVCGMGRKGILKKPLTIKDAIQLVKNHMCLEHLRVSFGNDHSLESQVLTVAVCAGSGVKVLSAAVADLYITGEMSHHDLLDAAHRGTTVFMCEHSNSERGFLPTLMNILQAKLEGVKLVLSKSDRDPVQFF